MKLHLFQTLKKSNDFPDEIKENYLQVHQLQNLRILLAEDSRDNETLIRVFLKPEGVKIDVAHNGIEAVAMAKAVPYDIVLMDIQMPILDGLEATRQLRASGFRAPILALTAHALREEVEKSESAGCNAHLTKPIGRQDLVAAILKAYQAIKFRQSPGKDWQYRFKNVVSKFESSIPFKFENT